MLVLSRKEGERIKIGEEITITVVRLSADKVRIGIEAPSNVLILRGELEQRSSMENHNVEYDGKLPMGALEFTLPLDALTMSSSVMPSSLAS